MFGKLKQGDSSLFPSLLIWSCKVYVMWAIQFFGTVAHETSTILWLLICHIEMCSVREHQFSFAFLLRHWTFAYYAYISWTGRKRAMSVCTHFMGAFHGNLPQRKIQFITECFVPSHWILVDGDLFICFMAGDSVWTETTDSPLPLLRAGIQTGVSFLGYLSSVHLLITPCIVLSCIP
jgi:hypothetical protein